MSKVFLIILISFSIIYSQNQSTKSDKIIKSDGTVINCKIISVDANNIEYKPEGAVPFRIIRRKDVLLIKYSNGEVVKFTESDNKIVQNNPVSKRESGFYDSNGSRIYKLMLHSDKYSADTENRHFWVHPPLSSDALHLLGPEIYYDDGAGNKKNITVAWSIFFNALLEFDGIKILIVNIGKPNLSISEFSAFSTFNINDGTSVVSQKNIPGFATREARTFDLDPLRYGGHIILPKLMLYDLIYQGGSVDFKIDYYLEFN